MSLTVEQQATTERRSDSPPPYVITIPTWVTDPGAAYDLAVRVVERLAGIEQMDTRFTTLGIEEEPLSEHQRIYAECVGSTPDVA
jgi:hypothetical protein